ncbi:MAG TPA: hypothetical protein VFS21_33970 [Roseiflexaceae bacterium]|nr:hypothetical protein [Roseiflexaceae bacterium]
MSIVELTRFLQIGQEKAFWRLSWRNAMGVVAGLILGGQLGRVWGMQGAPLFLLVAATTALGLWLSAERHGIWRVQRFGLLLRLRIRQLTDDATLDPDGWDAPLAAAPTPLRARTWDGHTLFDVRPLDERRNGTGTHHEPDPAEF